MVYDHQCISSDAFFQRCCKKCADNNSDNAACATCGFLANLACINFYDMIALTLIIIWLGMYTNFYISRLYRNNLTRIYIWYSDFHIILFSVIGTYWIFPHWEAVSDNPGESTCVPYLYWFSAAIAIITWITVVLSVLCGLLSKFCECFWGLLCCKPCRKADAQPVWDKNDEEEKWCLMNLCQKNQIPKIAYFYTNILH